MLSSHVAAVGGALFHRAAETPEVEIGDGNMAQLPGWAVIVFFADFLFFFPIFIYVSCRCGVPPPLFSKHHLCAMTASTNIDRS